MKFLVVNEQDEFKIKYVFLNVLTEYFSFIGGMNNFIKLVLDLSY
jgi:hypothetical protein